MALQAFPAVAHPSLAEIANCTNHGHAGREHTRMPNHAVAGLQHALHFATLRADRQSLNALAEIAESP